MEKSIDFCRLKYFFITLLISFFCFLFSGHKVYAATRTWDGGGGDTNWSTCANWDGPDICPVAGDTVQFNATSTKDSTVDSTFGGSIGVVSIATTYSGTITLAETLAVTSTFTQSGGTWDSSNQALSIASTFTLNNAGATFKASSGTTTFSAGLSITAGTFTHNSGNVLINGSTNVNWNCNGATFNTVTISRTGNTLTVGNTSACTLPLGNNPTVGGSITLTSATLSGTGTLTNAATFTMNGAATTLSGFSGLSTSVLTINNSSLTVDISGYSSFVASSTTTVTAGTFKVPSGASLVALTINGGTFTSATNLTETGTFTMSSGIFTAPSGTWTLSGGMNATAGTFNNNSGVVNVTGGSATFTACTGVTFNSVTFTGQSNTKTIGATCSFPLGNNPTIPTTVSLTGTLSGTGTLTISAGTLTLNAGASLSGFSALSVSAITISGATADFSTYTSFIAASTVTLSSGTLTLPNGADLNGALTISGGTFNAPAGTMTLAGSLTVSGGTGTFNANGGTITFDAGAATIGCTKSDASVISFNSIIINNTGTKTISTNCSLSIGANPRIPTSISVSGTLSGSGTLTVAAGTLTLSSSTPLSGFSALAAPAITVSSGTADFSSFSSFSASGAAQLNSGTWSLPSGADFNSTLTLTGGTFNAPAGNMTIAASFTEINAPVFNANGGTIIFDGASAPAITCVNTTVFNLVIFSWVSSNGTVGSSCTIPLGNNPHSTRGFNLLGTITGSGTLTIDAGTLTMNAASVISGITGLTLSSLNISGATFSADTYSPFQIVRDFTLASGTFTASAGDTHMGQNFTVSGGVFNNNGGTIIFDGTTGGEINCGNAVFNLVKISHTVSVFRTIDSNCTLPLGNDPVVNRGIILQGTLTGSGTLTVIGVLEMTGAGTLQGFTSINAAVLALIQENYDFSGFSSIDLNTYYDGTPGYFWTYQSTVIAPSVMTIYGGFYNDGGVFNANSGTVIFDGPNSYIANDPGFTTSTTFYNLTKVSTGADTFTFPVGTTTTVDGALTLQGGSKDAPLSLLSSRQGSQWSLDANGPTDLEFLSVQDSNNVSGNVLPVVGGVESGNNSSWFLGSSSLSLELDSPRDKNFISQSRPVFKWKRVKSLTKKTVTGYTLRVDNGDVGNWSITDIPVTGSGDVNTSKYTIHYDGFTDNDPDNDYISVWTHSSNDWTTDEFDGAVKEGTRRWYVTAKDNTGNSTTETRTMLVDTTAPDVEIKKIGQTGIKSNIPSFSTFQARPKFSGVLTDLSRFEDTKDETVASGPKSVQITIEKKQNNIFVPYLTTTVNVGQVFNQNTNDLITDLSSYTRSKYADFTYTPMQNLPGGVYRISFSGIDMAGNLGFARSLILVTNNSILTTTPITSSEELFPLKAPTVKNSTPVITPTFAKEDTESNTPSTTPYPVPTNIPLVISKPATINIFSVIKEKIINFVKQLKFF